MTALNSTTWLQEIGELLDACLAAKDEDAPQLVRRFLNLMALSPHPSDHLITSVEDFEALEPFFDLPALDSLLIQQLGDAIGICLSISADKNAIATAFSHTTEEETTFDSKSSPVAITGALAMLAARDLQSIDQDRTEASIN